MNALIYSIQIFSVPFVAWKLRMDLISPWFNSQINYSANQLESIYGIDNRIDGFFIAIGSLKVKIKY